MKVTFGLDGAKRIIRSRLPWRTRLSLLWLKTRLAVGWKPRGKYVRVSLAEFTLLLGRDSLLIDTQSMRGMLIDEYFDAPMRGRVVLDVGAHKGYYSARALLAGALHVYSFEPEELNQCALSMTWSAAPASVQRRWSVERCALGAADGEAVLNVSAESWSHSLLTPASGGVVGTQVVPVRRLSWALQQARRGHPAALIVVKLNIEGSAGTVLLSTSPDDWIGVTDLWCEFEANEPVALVEIEQHLAEAGLRRSERARTMFRYAPSPPGV